MLLKQLNKSEKNMVRINIIVKEKWIEHYREMWFQKVKVDLLVNDGSYEAQCVDVVTMDKRLEVLKEKIPKGSSFWWNQYEAIKVWWHPLAFESIKFIMFRLVYETVQ